MWNNSLMKGLEGKRTQPDKAALLPREKYAERQKEMGEFPTMEIEKHGQALYYFGANHSHDPENPQYDMLRHYWEAWLQKTDPRNRLVLVEGGKRHLHSDEKEAIRKDAEGGLATFLADQEKIPTESPEPDDHILRAQLLEKHSPIDIGLYGFLTTADSWSEMLPENRPDLQTFAHNATRRRYYSDFSYEELVSAFESKIGIPFDPEKIHEYCEPNRTDTIINKVARTNSDIRDQHIAEQIISYWKDGKSLFVVFGYGHLVIEEPMLRAAIK